MRIDWSTLALQTINALVLVWLLARFLFRPVADIIAKRRDAARKMIDEASAARDAANADRAAAQAELDKLAGARAEALEQVDTQAAAMKAELIEDARADAMRLRSAAAAEVDANREAEMRKMSDRASRLAVEITRKLFGRLPENARVAGFIDGLADGLAQLPEDARAALGTHGTPVRLNVACSLSAAQEQACREALARRLGRVVEIEVRVDSSLIAGLELEDAHVRVRNSFRQDLEQIEAALLDHDENGRSDE